MPVGLDAGTRALSELGARVVELVRSISLPNAPTKGLEWTLAETSVHLLQTVRVYDEALRGDNEPEGEVEDVPEVIARKNREEIAAEPERDPRRVAALLDEELRSFVATARTTGPDRVAVFSARYSATAVGVVCGLIGELAVHGWDIARSTGVRWNVDRDAALFAAYASAAAAPLVLDAAAAEDEDLHVRIKLRGGTPFSIRIRKGRAWSEVTHERPDATLGGDAFAYLLAAYGRVSPLPLMLRGRLFAYGRRPWALVKLPKLLKNP